MSRCTWTTTAMLSLTGKLCVTPNRQCSIRTHARHKHGRIAAGVAAWVGGGVIGRAAAAEQRGFPREAEPTERIVIADAIGDGAGIGLVRVVGEPGVLGEKSNSRAEFRRLR